MKIAIICAIENELNAFLEDHSYEKKIVKGMVYYYLNYKDHEIYLSKSDIGKVNAACLTTFTIMAVKPKIIINAGICKGINHSIKAYDTVCSTKITYHDLDFEEDLVKNSSCKKGVIKISKALLDKMPSDFIKGLTVSGDVFVTDKQKPEIVKKFPKALIVDIEGAPIVQASTLFNRKAVVIKTVSNISNDDEYWNNDYKACKIVCKKTFDFIDNL